jgi:PKD repeat protein
MKKTLPLIFLFLFFNCAFLVHRAFSQNSLVKVWDYRFGGTNYDELVSFQQTADRGYILGGRSISGMNGDKTQSSLGYYDFWIVKTDSLGIKQWDKVLGGTSSDGLNFLQQTRDGGFILGGYSYSGIGADKTQTNWDASGNTSDYWVIKIDPAGNKQWDKRFGGINNDHISSLQQTADGGYILGGYSDSGVSGDKSQGNWGSFDYWVIKIDSLGNKQWDKDFGGDNPDLLNSLQQTADGGYILGGHSHSGLSGSKTQPLWGIYQDIDYWVVKIDSLGNKQWDKAFGGTDYDGLTSLITTDDGGYMLAGWSESGVDGNKTQPGSGYKDYWIIKIDSLGNIQWQKDFGGSSEEKTLGTISKTLDNGYLLCGVSYSNISGSKTEDNLGATQAWIVKTDSLGNKQWDKTILTIPDEKGNAFALQSNDSCYIIARPTFSGAGGHKIHENWDTTYYTTDYWIVKFCDGTFMPPNALAAGSSFICPGTCTNYINLSTFGTSYQWYFPGATPDSSTSADPTNICYPAPGVYDVQLIATNLNGSDTLLLTNYVTVYPTPIPGTIIQNADTLFASPGGGSYQWYFNGNIIIGATTNLYVATQTGNYELIHSDSNGCESNSSIQNIPFASFNSPASVCPGTCTSFFNTSGCATSYQWYFSGAVPDTSTDLHPTNICYSAPGNYDVTLIATNANGSDTLQLTNYITVYPAAAAPGLTQSADTLFSNPGFISYQWYFNGSVIGGATDNFYVATQIGSYELICIDSNGCEATASIQNIPFASFNSSGSICPGTCTSFFNTSACATSYQWFFSGAAPYSSTDQHPTNICYSSPGSYDVTLVATNSNGSDTIILNNYIIVYPFSPPQAILQSGDTLFSNSGFNAYQWYLDSIVITGATDYFYEAQASGNYDLICVDGNGCEVWTSIDSVLANIPTTIFTTTLNHLCPGICTDFVNHSINANTFLWYFPGASPSASTDENPQSICYSTPGGYDVTLIAANSNGSDTLTLSNYITVYPFPAPQAIAQYGDTLFAIAGATFYQWYFDGNIIPGATDYFHTATANGDYNVVCIDNNNCEVEAVIYNVLTNTHSILFEKPLNLIPNPFINNLTIRDLEMPARAITIWTMVGEKVFKKDCHEPQKEIILNLSFLPSGIYNLRIETNYRTFSRKIVKM